MSNYATEIFLAQLFTYKKSNARKFAVSKTKNLEDPKDQCRWTVLKTSYCVCWTWWHPQEDRLVWDTSSIELSNNSAIAGPNQANVITNLKPIEQISPSCTFSSIIKLSISSAFQYSYSNLQLFNSKWQLKRLWEHGTTKRLMHYALEGSQGNLSSTWGK